MRTIETERLILRPYQVGDSITLFEMSSDRETCYDDGGYEPFEVCDETYQKSMDEVFLGDENRVVMALKDNNQAIGTVHLMPESKETYLIGYVINPSFRRMGYTYEAVKAVIEECFKNGVKLFVAEVYAYNQASKGLLNKLGFVKDGFHQCKVEHCKYGLVDEDQYFLERCR